jgi:hypothetical protein
MDDDARNQVGMKPFQGLTHPNIYSVLVTQAPLSMVEIAMSLGLTAEHQHRYQQLQESLEHMEQLGQIGGREYSDGITRWGMCGPGARRHDHCESCGEVQ